MQTLTLQQISSQSLFGLWTLFFFIRKDSPFLVHPQSLITAEERGAPRCARQRWREDRVTVSPPLSPLPIEKGSPLAPLGVQEIGSTHRATLVPLFPLPSPLLPSHLAREGEGGSRGLRVLLRFMTPSNAETVPERTWEIEREEACREGWKTYALLEEYRK